MKLLNKKILLGITGGIASYKTPDLVRLLVKSGAEVRVITTRSALDFVSPLALSVVSKHKVYTEFIEDNQWQSHIELGLWADLMLIAPATAHTISKMANGLCDNLLIATYLSARCPVVIAPAMDLDMFKHPSTQHNLSILNNAGCRFIGPEDGELASGLSGIGRMTEPLVIVDEIESIFASKNSLGGIRVVVTAGPTREAIDPVRFISNHSSGKMGYALALEAYERGAIVQLIRGKGANDFSHEGINIINVESSDEMALESAKAFSQSDVFLMAAAVADYKPKSVSEMKLKKTQDELSIELLKTTDILSDLGNKKSNQVLVGFALETNNELENAQKKLINKNLDLIVLNSLNDRGAGFGSDTNKITLIDSSNKMQSFPLKSKREVAADIFNKIEEILKSNPKLIKKENSKK